MRSSAAGLSTWSSRSPAPIRRRQNQLRNDTHARSQGFRLTGAREALAPRLGSGHCRCPSMAKAERATDSARRASMLTANRLLACPGHPPALPSHNKSACPLKRAKIPDTRHAACNRTKLAGNRRKMTGTTVAVSTPWNRAGARLSLAGYLIRLRFPWRAPLIILPSPEMGKCDGEWGESKRDNELHQRYEF
jgi:hypothetical protein